MVNYRFLQKYFYISTFGKYKSIQQLPIEKKYIKISRKIMLGYKYSK